MVWLEDLVPKDHLLRKIDAAVNFDKIYEDDDNDPSKPSKSNKNTSKKKLERRKKMKTVTKSVTDPDSGLFDLYKQRKETLERVFADAKEKHAMRYTPYRGLAQVSNWVRLKFAAMNLKKFAKRKWRDNHLSDFFASLSFFDLKYTKTPTYASA